ncbi:YigZ family protein [Mesoterricola silvestris]|nr:YigZ family protein [Mesoterricola silvestris]
MQRPVAPAVHRFREKASVFLTELHPAGDAGEREAILVRLRKRDFDANHHCTAWRELGGAQGADDDGEPSGTAGPPMLRVLEGEGLVDVLAVCIRWFGGTKLGTGGLVRAYTEGVQGAIAAAREQGLLEAVRAWRAGSITAEAGQAHLPFSVLGAFPEAEILGQDFRGAQAILRFRLPLTADGAREAALAALWLERSRGGRVDWE